MAHGGKVPVLNTTLADNSIYSYGTGYSGQQLAPHSELTGTIQEITIPRYRYATNNQPYSYHATHVHEYQAKWIYQYQEVHNTPIPHVHTRDREV